MYNYHGGKLVLRGPNPLSSHITVAFKKFTRHSILCLRFFCNMLFKFFYKAYCFPRKVLKNSDCFFAMPYLLRKSSFQINKLEAPEDQSFVATFLYSF